MQSRAKKVITTPNSTTTITASFSISDNDSPDSLPTSTTEESIVTRSDIEVDKGCVNFTTTKTNKLFWITGKNKIESEEVTEKRITCKL